MNSRRIYGPTILATIAAGGLAFFAASRTWAETTDAAEGLREDVVTVSGSAAEPLVTALALVAVTAALAVLAASPRIRRLVGALVTVVALVALLLVLTRASSVETALRSAVEKSPAFTGSNTPDTSTRTIWPLVTAAAYVLLALLGVVIVRHGPRWPTMGSRYDAPAAHAADTATESDADMWAALDEGRDPTQ